MGSRTFATTLLVGGFLLAGCQDRQAMSLDDLRRTTVLGATGLPLGTCFAATAEVIPDPAGKDDDRYGLAITAIDGRPVARLTMAYQVRPWVKTMVPNDVFDADRKLNPDRDAIGADGEHRRRTLTSAEIAEMDSKYVGITFQLVVYETAQFSGLPENPRRYPFDAWQDTGYALHDQLIVIRDLGERQDASQ